MTNEQEFENLHTSEPEQGNQFLFIPYSIKAFHFQQHLFWTPSKSK